jgi:hypothetical protein
VKFAPRFLVCAGVGLLLAAALPVYPRRTMSRSFMVGGGGDEVSYGFTLSTLPGFFAKLRYMRPEESPVATTIANVVFFIALGGSFGLAGAWFWSRRRPG